MLRIEGIPFVDGVLTLGLGNLLVALAIMLLVSFLIYAILERIRDFYKVPIQKVTGTILEKIYTPFSHTPLKEGGSFGGASYYVKLKLSLEREPSVGVTLDLKTYNAIKEGDQVAVSYQKGKNTGELKILEISLA